MRKKRIKRALLLKLKPPIYDFNDHPIGFRPPYTLKYIEALLLKKAVCFVKLIDQRIINLSFNEILNNVYRWCPDIIILSVSTLDMDISLKFCQLVKEEKECKDTIIIGMGQGLSADIKRYDSFKALFDIVLAGESEQKTVSIVEKLGEGISISEIKKFCSDSTNKHKLIEVPDLDSLPFPVYDLDSLKGYYFVYPLKVKRRLIWGHVLASRGCPHSCIFCSQIMRETYGKSFRGRSTVNVVDEIENLLKLGANIITFDDDNFTTSKKHVEAICREIKLRKLSVQWIAHARVDEVTPSLLSLMKEAGCMLLRFGIESGSERIIETLRKTNDSHAWLDKSKDIVNECRLLGISVACLFIVGSPTETIDELWASIRFAQDLSPDIVQVAYFTPFPGSKAYSLFKNRIKEMHTSKMYHYKEPLVNLSGMSDSDLRKAQGIFYKAFLMRPGFIVRHIYKYIWFYLTNPDVFFKLIRITRRMFLTKSASLTISGKVKKNF